MVPFSEQTPNHTRVERLNPSIMCLVTQKKGFVDVQVHYNPDRARIHYPHSTLFPESQQELRSGQIEVNVVKPVEPNAAGFRDQLV